MKYKHETPANLDDLFICVQLPRFMWVDNSRTVGAQLCGAIPSLSKVLEDGTHVLRRIFELIPDAHSCKGRWTLVASALWCLAS